MFSKNLYVQIEISYLKYLCNIYIITKVNNYKIDCDNNQQNKSGSMMTGV